MLDSMQMNLLEQEKDAKIVYVYPDLFVFATVFGKMSLVAGKAAVTQSFITYTRGSTPT